MSEKVKDRRKHPRVESNLGATVTAADGGFEATVKNISLSGLLLIANQAVPEMTIVGMRLAFPARPERNSPAIALELTGAVVRCEPCEPGSERHELAIFLTDMNRESREALHEFIKSRHS